MKRAHTKPADLARTLKAAEKLAGGIVQSIRLAREAAREDAERPDVQLCVRRARRLCVSVERLLSGGVL